MKLVYRFCIHFGLSTPRQLKISFAKVFMQTYLVRKRITRKGSCNHGLCAKERCCKNCEWLVEKDGKYFCKDYENAPQNCKDFPLDEKELKRINVENVCGFYWGDNNKK